MHLCDGALCTDTTFVHVTVGDCTFTYMCVLGVYVCGSRRVSASVPLTAIAQAIQEIEVLCKHRHMNWTTAQGQERNQLFL